MKQASSDKTLFEENISAKGDLSAVQVLVPVPLDMRKFDYAHTSALAAGSYVNVPFGRTSYLSVVWDDKTHQSNLDIKKLKPIDEVYDFPVMPEKHRRFLEWVAKYTMSDLGSVLKLSISVTDALEKPKKIPAYTYNRDFSDSKVKITPKRQEIIDYLKHHTAPIPYHKIKEDIDASHAVLKALVDAKVLKIFSVEPETDFNLDDYEFAKVDLSDKQKKAVDFLLKQKQKENSVTLIDGVTGSGKTEVYFEAVEDSILKNKQVLILLPEIALTEQVVRRFKARFGFEPTLWHSHLTPAQRRDNWRKIALGKARVVIGARSALFIPYPNLELIVIDEEHDNSYKQEEGILYNARDMAIVKSSVEKLHIILASATPSLETLMNCEQDKYQKIILPSRYGDAVMPDIHLVDMRRSKTEKEHWISPELTEALNKNFARQEQSLLFLNRRGYAPLTLCNSCGHRFQCHNCDTWLVEHKRFHRLQCHHCGFVIPKPDSCPECGSFDSIIACGPGVERIVEEVRHILPLAKIAVLSSDNMNDQEVLRNTLYQITKGKVDVIVGTQMLAKGHHFPKLTLVGVIDADLGMNGGDLRASEKTYQILQQVSGRSGREHIKGEVYIQTFNPDNKVMKALASGDRDAFIEAELSERDAADMPPFTRLVSLIISCPDERVLSEYCKLLATHAPISEEVMTFGPAPAPIGLLRGQHRTRFLIRAEKNIHIQKTIDFWLSQIKKPNNIKVQIDIDPNSFL